MCAGAAATALTQDGLCRLRWLHGRCKAAWLGQPADASPPVPTDWTAQQDASEVVQDLFRARWHSDKISRELGLTNAEIQAILRRWR